MAEATQAEPQFTAPQKVCPHCGAIAQTTAKKCPNCGKGYKKRTWLKVLVALCVLGAVAIVGCAALIGSAANEVGKQLDAEQQAHAISRAKFNAIKLGMTEDKVIETAGKQPEDKQEFENAGVLDDEPQNSSCIYYNRAGGDFGDLFQFCFTSGKLDAKNAY
jgi:ribosomal protein L40E